jgi:cytidylate kinase
LEDGTGQEQQKDGGKSMAVVAVCKDFASGGRELGRLLAKKLGYHYVDKHLFQQMAEDLHVSEGTLESFEQSREYRIPNLFFKFFSKSYIQRIVGYDRTVVEEKEYQNSLKNLILGVAREGDAVIIGRAAYYFLKDMEGCYRFRLVAPVEWRKTYAVEKLGVSLSQAQNVIEKRDRNQDWFLRSVCGEDFDNALWFHLTLNMSLIPLVKAAELVQSVLN